MIIINQLCMIYLRCFQHLLMLYKLLVNWYQYSPWSAYYLKDER